MGDIESAASTRVGPADTRVGPAQRRGRPKATRVGPADDARSGSPVRRVRDEPPTARLGPAPAVGIGRAPRSARVDTVRLGETRTKSRTTPRTLRVVDDDERPVSSVGDIRLDVDGLVAELAAEAAPPATVEVHELEVLDDPTTIARRDDDDDDDPTEIMVDEDGETVSGGHRPTQHTAIAPAPVAAVATRDDTLPMDSHSQPVLRYPPPIAGSGPSPVVHVPHSGPLPIARRASPMGWLIIGFIALGLGTITAAAWTYEGDTESPDQSESRLTPRVPSAQPPSPSPEATPASAAPPAAPRVPTPAAPAPTVTPAPVPTPAPPIPEEEELTVIEDEPEPAAVPAPKPRKTKRRRKRGRGKSKLDGMYPSG
jgi:hypothetical protein